MYSNRVFLLISLGLVFLVFGCNGPKTPANLPKLYPCKITVVQDGKPLEDAMVTVYNDLGFVIAGKTDAKGVATITVDGRWPGVPEGEHVISISKITEPTDLPPPPQSMFSAEGRNYMEQLTKGTKETVDPKYSAGRKSELRLNVGKKSTNETFDVGAAVEITPEEPL